MEDSWWSRHCVSSVQEVCFWCKKKYHAAKFSSFKSGEERLDSFLSEILQMQVEYQDLWLTMQLLLTLSHGQATVERGFSVNKEVLNSKSSGSKLISNQTCSQFSVSPEHKGCKLGYHWSTSIFLQSCFKQIQYVPHGKERRKEEDWEGKKEKGTWGRSNCSKKVKRRKMQLWWRLC